MSHETAVGEKILKKGNNLQYFKLQAPAGHEVGLYALCKLKRSTMSFQHVII